MKKKSPIKKSEPMFEATNADAHEVKVQVDEPTVQPIPELAQPTGKSTAKPKTDQPHWLTVLKTDKRAQWLAIIVVILLVVAGAAGAVYYTNYSDHTTTTVTNKKNKSKNTNKVVAPTVLPRQIDGQMVAAADANKVPACVMIENADFEGVRPQAGLSSAQVVYEVVVEGGITRFMAVFAGGEADKVGPVRSARDTYLEFASEYNCGYFHAGGSYTAMQAIRNFKLRDVDGLLESKWYWRDSQKYSPHNLFTSTSNAYQAISEGHAWTEAPTYDSWLFADDQKPTTLTANEVNVEFGGGYNVQYKYNTANANYERYDGGAAHTDSNSGDIITTRNVILEHVPAGIWIEGKGRVNFAVTGEGAVEIFHEGVVLEGTWKKADRLARTKFYDADGNELPLVRGNTWVEVVPDGVSSDWK